MRSITEIVSDTGIPNSARAKECLRVLDALDPRDPEREDFRSAAQTFALLAIADSASLA
jgi:hypothetical protein